MKKIILLSCIVVLTAFAQWTNVSGPGFANVTAFTKWKNGILLGTNYQGLHYTTDNGNTWNSPYNGDLTNYRVTSLFAHDTVLLAGISFGSSSGLYKWSNGEKNWKKIISASSNEEFTSIVKVDSVIIAVNKNAYYSTDFGLSWKTASSGLPYNTKIASLAVNGSTVFAGAVSGIYKSINYGVNWTEVRKNTLYTEETYSLASGNGTVYLATHNGGMNSGKDSIYKSTNNGDTWSSIKNNLPQYLYGQYLLAYGDTVFYGNQSAGIFRSTDAGQTWNIDTVGLTNLRTQTGFISDGIIYSGGSAEYGGTGGLFISTNNGDVWIGKSNPLYIGKKMKTSILQVGEKLFIGGDDKGVFVSTDRGATWTASNSGLIASGNPVALSNMISKEGIIFGAASTGNNSIPQGIFSSTDSGATWNPANTGLKQYSTVYNFYIDADTLYACLKEGLYRTTDNGANWTTWGTGLPKGMIYSVVVKNDTMYAANASVNVYRSLNRGRTWVTVKTTIKDYYYPGSLFVAENKLYAIANTNYGKLLSCADTGATWVEVNGAALGNQVQSVIAVKNYLLARVMDKGLFLSTNGGTDWTDINKGLFKGSLQSLSVSYIAWDTIYAWLNEGGLVKRGAIEVGLTKVRENRTVNIPQEISLQQNFPNPFNPTTTITFSLSSNFNTTLKVYDILGKEVATLVNENLSPGKYSIQFNATKLSSGIYFYRLQTGNFVETKRMVILK